ncbi:DNA-3-methyladenine glycosylase family protein [Streptomyces sp. NBC_01465]|uniref:DNA-3-methyladenine glycosylase family protein n=1 Tax=Streptomyces sp. NBC_01465 TaxID=2903878 RepID=UPI002E2FF5DF|nr:DNA-3-methyladenine glycosylase 2 family protein [Streptomyces sp. NBC_01465]
MSGRFPVGSPTDLTLILGPLRRGPGDPTCRIERDGTVWRVSRTPKGPATLRVDPSGAEVWGPGADWMRAQLPSFLGELDDPSTFVAHHRLVAESARRAPSLRLTRTGLVMESLIPSILEQKVTTDEAYRAWRLLVRKYGEEAPGPAPAGMHVIPTARTWSLIPSWEWHKAGVDDKRAATILRAVRVAPRLEQAASMSPEAAAARLQLIPGIGPWTTAEVLQRALGAPDAITTGDLHLPNIIGYALTGAHRSTDEEMLHLLAPYEGHRHRAARLILLTGRTPPRRQPKMPVANIASL